MQNRRENRPVMFQLRSGTALNAGMQITSKQSSSGNRFNLHLWVRISMTCPNAAVVQDCQAYGSVEYDEFLPMTPDIGRHFFNFSLLAVEMASPRELPKSFEP
jgi:hypothetical protein